jgi:hypothetical protein
MCNCRSLVSRTLLLLCLANMHPTVTAFSMNSWARVCKKMVNPRGCEGARGRYLQHMLNVRVECICTTRASGSEAISHAAAQHADADEDESVIV